MDVFHHHYLLSVKFLCTIFVREEQRSMVYEKRALRIISGPKRKVWRKLHNEALHNLCSSPNVIRVINEGE
jgi:hypothetical protein